MKVTQLCRLVFGLVLFRAAICSSGMADAAATPILWSNPATAQSWTNGNNWTGSVEPTTSEIAQFAVNPTGASSVGINDLTPNVGAVEVTSSRTTTLSITNLTGTAAASQLTLNGVLVDTTVGGTDTANVILHHAGSATMTITNGAGATRTLTVDLPNNPAGGNVVAVDGGSRIVVNSPISGVGGITLRGIGGSSNLELGSAASSYAGDTIVSQGQILANANAPHGAVGAFGNSTNAVIVGDANTGAVDAFLMTGSAVTIGRQVLITNNGAGLAGIGANTNSSSAFSGLVTFNRDMVIGQFGTTGTLTVSGGLTAGTAGAKTVTIGKTGFDGAVIVSTNGITDGSGTVAVNIATVPNRIVQFTADNTYSGDTTITTGRLRVSGGNGIPNGPGTGNLVMNAGTQFGIVSSETINGLSGSGIVDNDANAARTLTIGDNDATSTFSGKIANTSSNVNGTLSLIKIGAGTLTLSGNNSYVGATTINAGTLLVNGTHSGLSGAPQVSAPVADYTVASDATLGGTGRISANVIVQNGGTLSPGASIGTLTVGGAEINGMLRIEGAGGLVDKLMVGTFSPVGGGDFNSDGFVDAADYVIWRKSIGDDTSYNEWRTNFGDTETFTGGNLNIDNATLDLSGLGSLSPGTHVLAQYGSLLGSGQFAGMIGSIPDGFALDYDFEGNKIALVGAASAQGFSTTVVPEPTGMFLVVVAGLMMAWRRGTRCPK